MTTTINRFKKATMSKTPETKTAAPLALAPTAPAAPPESQKVVDAVQQILTAPPAVINPPAPAGAPGAAPATAPKPMVPPPVLAAREVPDRVDPLLVKILSWRRRHGSVGEKQFNAFLMSYLGAKIKEIPGAKLSVMSKEENIVVEVPHIMDDGTQKMADVLFSCHVDTVDMSQPTNNYFQSVAYDANFGHLFLDKSGKDNGTCLGADDGVGVWIMLKMIEAGVAGSYVFHRGEERSGIGSRAMVRDCSDWIKQHNVAVAFDRPNDHEVITHQGGVECASDKFAKQLALALNAADQFFAYAPSNRGVYTDTKEYRRLVAECVNIGVGYTNQHGVNEVLDYGHALALMEAAIDIDWHSLPIERDCTKPDPYTGYYGSRNYGGAYGDYDMDDFHGSRGRQYGFDWDDKKGKPKDQGTKNWPKDTKGAAHDNKGKPSVTPLKTKSKAKPQQPDILDEIDTFTYEEIVEFVVSDPEQATAALMAAQAELAAAKARIAKLQELLGIQ